MQPEVERELIRKCKTGDTRFYEPLVRAYEPSGLRLAMAMMGNTEDAQDALQEAFVKSYRSLHRFDLRRPFGPWFFQLLRNQCRDMLRSRQARFILMRFILDATSALNGSWRIRYSVNLGDPLHQPAIDCRGIR